MKFFEKQFDSIVEYNNNEINANAQSFVAYLFLDDLVLLISTAQHGKGIQAATIFIYRHNPHAFPFEIYRQGNLHTNAAQDTQRPNPVFSPPT